MRSADFRAQQAKAMSEKQLQEMVVALARRYRWLVYHTHDSRRSEPGFPDLVLVQAEHRRVLWRELKSVSGTVTAAQEAWLRSLRSAGCDAGVWRPAQWMDGTIEKELRNVGR